MLNYYYLFLPLILLTSCVEASPDVLLSNLEVTISLDDTDPREIEVSASAENASFYRFYFGVEEGSFRQTGGIASYIYPSSGTYTLIVQAHASATEFISYEETIVIPEPALPSNLAVTFLLSGADSLVIDVNATAENANFYWFYFGEEAGVFQETSGSATYSYAAPGTYTLEVQAHATETRFIRFEEDIEIPEVQPGDGYVTPEAYDGMQLVWQDEFNEGTLNLSDWTYDIGDGCPDLCGWGNNELQSYAEENVLFEDGKLIIEAKKEARGSREYTSAKIITKGKQSFQYGRIDIRAILPEGQGLWPALWMLGSNIDEIGWPACGEIDIMEMVGGNGRENTVLGTLHWDSNGNHACTCGIDHDYILTEGDFSDQFHVFSLIWDETTIEWYVDDNLYVTVDVSPADLEEFRNDFYFIFNVAVGGNLPGNPDATSVFPQRMIVDYVRVFQPN